MARRRTFLISDEVTRAGFLREAAKANLPLEIQLGAPRRTLPQNNLMWSILGDLSKQVKHNGRFYDPDVWKVLGMVELGLESVEWIPSLRHEMMVPIGLSSRKLLVGQMNDLIEILYAFGAEREVKWTLEPAAKL